MATHCDVCANYGFQCPDCAYIDWFGAPYDGDGVMQYGIGAVQVIERDFNNYLILRDEVIFDSMWPLRKSRACELLRNS